MKKIFFIFSIVLSGIILNAQYSDNNFNHIYQSHETITIPEINHTKTYLKYAGSPEICTTGNSINLNSNLTIKHIPDSQIIFKRNAALNQLTRNRKLEFVYNPKAGNITEKNDYLWSKENNRWYIDNKAVFIFNEENKRIEEVNYEWNSNNSQWYITWKSNNIYDTNGYISQKNIYEWDSRAKDWRFMLSMDYRYDSNGNLLCFDDPVYRDQYEYDSLNRLNQYFKYSLSDYGLWHLFHKKEYSYLEDGRLSTIVGYHISYYDGEWIADTRYEYIYYTDSSYFEYIIYLKEDDAEEWSQDSKKAFYFDANGNPIKQIVYNFYQDLDQFVPDYKWEFTYNVSLKYSDVIRYPCIKINAAYASKIYNLPVEAAKFQWDANSNDYILTQKDIYYFSDLEVSIDKPSHKRVRIYPNPCTDQITIGFPDQKGTAMFEMFDITGKMVMKKVIASGEIIGLETINKGVYIYLLRFDNEHWPGKIIKE